MTSIFLSPNDPNRLLSSTEEIEVIQAKVEQGKCKKLIRLLTSVSEGNLSDSLLPEEAIT